MDCFNAYDIRGKFPEQINADNAYHIGNATARTLNATKLVVGYDIRLSSPELAAALHRGICQGGADVYDIGCCGTEEVYFATATIECDGGLMITASHNPASYNGIKIVRQNASPMNWDTGLKQIKDFATQVKTITPQGTVTKLAVREQYVDYLLSRLNVDRLQPLNIVSNAGHGNAGPVIDLLADKLPFQWHKIHNNPDGHFPIGVPNPMLVEQHPATSRAIQENSAHIGIAWDCDFDRCFIFDEKGEFIQSYYLINVLAQHFLNQQPNSCIVCDPRLIWYTRATAEKYNGQLLMSRAGHSYFKTIMRDNNAIYGGEISGHHYFRDFFHCDSGMLTWLLMSEYLSRNDMPLSSLISVGQRAYPSSGEISYHVDDPASMMQAIEKHYKHGATSIDYTDGVSIEYPQWRCNIRQSVTQPLLRLNVETRGNAQLLETITNELLTFIR